jgi:hypothetical protein
LFIGVPTFFASDGQVELTIGSGEVFVVIVLPTIVGGDEGAKMVSSFSLTGISGQLGSFRATRDCAAIVSSEINDGDVVAATRWNIVIVLYNR